MAFTDFVKFLASLTFNELKSLVSSLSREHIKVIKEILTNILHGNVELTPEQLAYLKKQRNIIRKLASKDLRRKILQKNCKTLHCVLRIAKDAIDENY